MSRLFGHPHRSIAQEALNNHELHRTHNNDIKTKMLYKEHEDKIKFHKERKNLNNEISRLTPYIDDIIIRSAKKGYYTPLFDMIINKLDELNKTTKEKQEIEKESNSNENN